MKQIVLLAHRLGIAIFLLLAGQGVSQAGAVTMANITFLGAPTGVNDGIDYVLPYRISIDQGTGAVDQNVICYDVFDNVTLNQTWTADLFSLPQAIAYGYFSANPGAQAQYEEVAWLSAQTYANNDQQVALQHAMWDVFGSAPPDQNQAQTAYVLAYQNAAADAAATGYSAFDFRHSVFVEQVGAISGQASTAQAFIYQSQAPFSSNSFDTPEPTTVSLLLAGLILIAVSRRRVLITMPRSDAGNGCSGCLIRKVR